MKRSGILLVCVVAVISMAFAVNGFAESSYEKARKRAKSGRKSASPKIEELSSLKGPKKTIAVMDFDNKAGGWSEWNIGNGMSEMLTTALFNSGRFVVVERQAITDVLAEQDLGASGRTTEAGAAKIGKVLNSQVLVRGAVTEFSNRSQDASNLVSFAGVNVGLASSSAHVAVNIRLYDATTGEVIESIRCEGKASSGGISGGYSGSGLGGLNFGSKAFLKTPLGKATQKVIDNAVYQISQKMEEVPWQGKVVTVKGDTVYLNAGANSNVQIGDIFTVYKKGESLIDPDTGISLGSEDTRAGQVEVFAVEEKFSKAHATAGSAGSFDRGDVVKVL